MMAYFPELQSVLIFGGYDGQNYLGDTWLWNEVDGFLNIDAQLDVSPSGRVLGSMAYLPAENAVILHGGTTNLFEYQDTWMFTTDQEWIQLSGVNYGLGPVSSAGAMALAADGTLALLKNDEQELWGFPPWEIVPTETGLLPDARRDHSMIYDEQLKRNVVFGGIWNDGAQNLMVAPEFWVFDALSAQWEVAPPMSATGSFFPEPRFGHSHVYVPALSHSFVVGGAAEYDQISHINETLATSLSLGNADNPTQMWTRRVGLCPSFRYSCGISWRQEWNAITNSEFETGTTTPLLNWEFKGTQSIISVTENSGGSNTLVFNDTSSEDSPNTSVAVQNLDIAVDDCTRIGISAELKINDTTPRAVYTDGEPAYFPGLIEIDYLAVADTPRLVTYRQGYYLTSNPESRQPKTEHNYACHTFNSPATCDPNSEWPPIYDEDLQLDVCCQDSFTALEAEQWYIPVETATYIFSIIDLASLEHRPSVLKQIRIGSSGPGGRSAEFKNVQIIGKFPICPGY